MARWSTEYRYFLKRLKEAREDAGLSQRQAAAQLGRLQSYISKSELANAVDVVNWRSSLNSTERTVLFLPESLSGRPRP